MANSDIPTPASKVLIQSTTGGITFIHGDYTSIASLVPTDEDYTWYLFGLLPGSADVRLCGVDVSGKRVLCITSSGTSKTMQCTASWLGIKKTL